MGGTLNAQNPIRLRLTEPQERFLFSEKKHPAFVAGFGAGKSEVSQLDVIAGCVHQQVLGLQIAVEYAVLVQEDEGLQDLVQELLLLSAACKDL